MSVTVKELAKAVGTPVEKLILQLREAGVTIEAEDSPVAPQDKQALLAYLRRSTTSTTPSKEVRGERITITRKSVSQIKVAGSKKPGGRAAGSVVNVEVRKKRTYVKRSPIPEPETHEHDALPTEKEELIEEVASHLIKSSEGHPEEGRTKKDSDATTEVSPLTAELPADVFQLEEPAPTQIEETLSPEEQRKQAEERASREQEELQKRRSESKFRRKLKARAKRDADEEGFDAPPIAPLFDLKHQLGSRDALLGDKTLRRTRRSKTAKEIEAEENVFAISRHSFERPTVRVVREVLIPETLTVAQLAEKMSVKATEVIRALIKMGAMATINQVIDQDTASLVAEEMGHKAKLVRANALEESLFEQAKPSDHENESPRAPVVTIMGHVDHGKTSLLDVIRRTTVQQSEAGGITQHIGAYCVHVEKGDITFLDTPGHAAFTAMRARGAKCTDIVVLVVAADDGVMPQTEEAIAHAHAAKVPIVVAINKIDKPDADLERVRQELASRDVLSEEWGGQVLFVPVSAKTGQGVDKLLEAILLQAEICDLKAVAEGPARGVVIESRLDKGRGPIATILVQAGQLRRGDILLAGTEYGRIRALLDEKGNPLEAAGPSRPVEVLGLSSVPNAGDVAFVVADEKKARYITQLRQTKLKDTQLARAGVTTENLFAQMDASGTKILNIALKADVHGSLEALREALSRLSNPDVKIAIVHQGVGGINESDIQLAKTSHALMIGFNVRAEAAARRLAETESIPIYYYSIIYDVIAEVGKTAHSLIPPKIKEVILGTAEVRNVFNSSKMGAVAGCMVVDGTVKRGRPIRVLRNHIVIYQGELESLRRFKEDAAEVRSGMECGIGVKNYNDVKTGDQIEVFERVEVKEAVV